MRDEPVDLVTGGAGFIGSHLVKALLGSGRKVRVIDDLSTGSMERLKDFEGLDVVQADLSTADLLPSLAGVERVFHLAAVPSVPRSVADPERAHRSIATATVRLLDAARRHHVSALVLSSSSSVYGDAATLPKHEGLSPAPVSPYAVAKLAAEAYGRAFARLYGLRIVSLRYFNVFGPGQDPTSEYAAVIPRSIQRALAGQPLTIFGDGDQTRDFTYVDNVISANLAAAQADFPVGSVYNIAAGSPVSINALVEAIERLAAVPLQVHRLPARPGDIRHSHADITAAARDLGWQPHIGFEDGLSRTLDWFRARSGSPSAQPN